MLEDGFRFVESAFKPELSNTLLTGLAQLDLTTPFGFEDLRGGDTAGWIWIED